VKKRFEDNIKKSCDEHKIFCYRLKDNPLPFAEGRLRFTSTNPCDFFIFHNGKLALIEAKEHKGVSLPLSCIRDNQIKGLKEAVMYDNVIAGFLVFFSDTEQCFFMSIQNYLQFVRSFDRKSIPIDYFLSNCLYIDTKKKKVNYRYGVERIFEDD
jgi:recombination protein U